MGGSGSGNWYRWSTKSTTADYWKFQISGLKKYGLLKAPTKASGSWVWSQDGEQKSSVSYEINTLDEYSPYLRVHYTNTKTQEKHDYKINLSTTSLNYGGKRWWFHCPARGCGKRVGVLYLATIFACRHCYNLAYPTQNESPAYRILSQARKIHKQLGGDGCIDDWIEKPKGMHHKTFEQKVERMHQLNGMAAMAILGRVTSMLR